MAAPDSRQSPPPAPRRSFPPSRGHHRRNVALWAVGAIVVLALGAFVGAGWYYSGEIYAEAIDVPQNGHNYDLEVLAVGEGYIDLAPIEGTNPHGEWTRGGIHGLEWNGGYTSIGEIIDLNGERVRRAFALDPGSGGPAVGTRVRMDSYAFNDDPLGRGMSFENVQIDTPVGSAPAWVIPGESTSWVIFVHGRHAERAESLRMLPSVLGTGASALVISYRNDAGAPESADHEYHWGETEWEDLEAAVAYAVSRGATDVVLVGYSMGGAIVLSFMSRSERADLVRGVILDAPAISLSSMVDMAASDRSLPGPLTWLGKEFAAWRYGIDWEAIDYADEARSISVPVLLFHGTEDSQTPLSDSEAWANDRPDNVRFVPVEEAGHVRSWNFQPALYESEVEAFIGKLIPAVP